MRRWIVIGFVAPGALMLIFVPVLVLGVFASLTGGHTTAEVAADASGRVSKAQFAAATLDELGAPVTTTNIGKLVIWMQHESGGGGGDFNPFNYVVPTEGSTAYNSVGVQNYPDVATGVAMSARLLAQGNTTPIRTNLLADGPWPDFFAAVGRFYALWTGPLWARGLAKGDPAEAHQWWNTPVNGKVAGVPLPAVGGGVVTAGSGLRIVLAALHFVGVPYANGNPAKGDPGIQFSGHPGGVWVEQHFAVRDARYSTIDCSGLTNAVMFLAFGVDLNYCSADYLHDGRFAHVRMDQLEAGDFVLRGGCGPTGHVAIVAAYNPQTGLASTIDAARHGTVVGFRAQQQVSAWSFTDAVRYAG